MAEGARAGGFQTGLGMPIVADGTIWGAIVTGTEEEALPEGAEERFTAFTELVAVAISNAKAREDLRRVVEEQASLRRVATLVAQEASQAEVFAAVAEEVATTLGVAHSGHPLRTGRDRDAGRRLGRRESVPGRHLLGSRRAQRVRPGCEDRPPGPRGLHAGAGRDRGDARA